MNYNGKTYTLVPSKSGDFEGVKAICESKGLSVYEPRDNVTYYTVFEATQKAGMKIIYLNMQRKWLENEEKWEPFRYVSDNTELIWNHGWHSWHYADDEACLTTYFSLGGGDDWISLRCNGNGQIVCQN